ncbi:hypothetical protein Peur_048733 [Populus x canadensis]
MTRKAVKRSIIADHLADHAMEDYESLDFEFPDEDVLAIEEEKSDWWIMYFDGAVNEKVVKKFIERDLICRYGPPEKIITDNAQNFNGKMIIELCAKWKIKHSNSSPYRPKMNGAVEAANKNVKKIIQKMVVTYKDWHEMLPFALHAYRTAVRTSTGATPYTLVYGMEAVMPLEVEIPSLRVLVDSELGEVEWAKEKIRVNGRRTMRALTW